MNAWIIQNMKILEMTGVLMRVGSFSFVCWLGPSSPFMWIWFVNTCDAVLLAWCALLRRDTAYTVLNGFWILVGLVGMSRSLGLL